MRKPAIGAIGQRAEADQGGGGAGVAAGGFDDLEHSAAAIRPASFCCAEQVAVGVGDHAGERLSAVGAIGQRAEADQRRQIGSVRLARRDGRDRETRIGVPSRFSASFTIKRAAVVAKN